MCSLSLFHYSEYLVTAIINPHSLSLDSFLLNHSVEYTLAAISSWLEFTVEKLTVPGTPAPDGSCLFYHDRDRWAQDWEAARGPIP